MNRYLPQLVLFLVATLLALSVSVYYEIDGAPALIAFGLLLGAVGLATQVRPPKPPRDRD
ncbi:hypothetical protein [Mesorhizobium sp. B2-3-4]|uniref:hypothetical protein n=1 Tax=Mesorhizobium sp. B2-3-4 TaxID=2589959 RepID=UPI00112DF1A9|nr:hypothetical protein [Mesorhizobium sp. B2-3-4]TPM34170.1 hypothetical protein FJ967_22285 [Mesorhizobium sp. B2-3-4]